jgi:hypothetical protein
MLLRIPFDQGCRMADPNKFASLRNQLEPNRAKELGRIAVIGARQSITALYKSAPISGISRFLSKTVDLYKISKPPQSRRNQTNALRLGH